MNFEPFVEPLNNFEPFIEPKIEPFFEPMANFEPFFEPFKNFEPLENFEPLGSFEPFQVRYKILDEPILPIKPHHGHSLPPCQLLNFDSKAKLVKLVWYHICLSHVRADCKQYWNFSA